MARTWEQEKAYCRRRAAGLFSELEQAIANRDKDGFSVAYQAAMRYATKRELAPYYKRFMTAILSDRRTQV